MAIAASFIAAGLAVWAGLYARRASLPVMVIATLIVGYVLGHSFWNAHVGPLPLTLDRLLLLGLATLFAHRVWTGKVKASAVSTVDWAIVLTLVWLSLSAFFFRIDDTTISPSSPFWRLVMGFWTPAFLFLVMRQSRFDSAVAKRVLTLLVLLGSYLAVTALAESAGLWGVVFPRYIADPELGLHYGRARGPALNSVSLGIFLSVCFWAAWTLLPRASRLGQLLLVAAMALMAFGVLLTYTRSTWIGLAASGLVVLAAQLPKRLRVPVLSGIGIAGILAASVLWQSIVQLEREDSGGVSQHSVQQRTAFAYVSWKMFSDHPLWGAGFGRFYDQKLPYLSDRSQSFELESLRDLHHHNTFLSLLTETGMVGLAAYVAVLGGMLACSWWLSQATNAAPHERSLGVLGVATVMVYLPSAVFHDLTHLHADQWLLFIVAGMAVGCERRLATKTAATVAAEPIYSPTLQHTTA
ncbi:MAG: O-antigen ligase family protein [Planctomycetota bacterium]